MCSVPVVVYIELSERDVGSIDADNLDFVGSARAIDNAPGMKNILAPVFNTLLLSAIFKQEVDRHCGVAISAAHPHVNTFYVLIGCQCHREMFARNSVAAKKVCASCAIDGFASARAAV